MLGHLSLQCVVFLTFCNIFWKCVLILFPFLRLAERNLQMWRYYSIQLDDEIRAKMMMLRNGYRKMFDQSICKSKDLGDMLRLLPGVVVQKDMSVQGMADLYRIKPDLLERFIKSTIEPLRSESPSIFRNHNSPYKSYKLEHYLSGFLRNQDRSQLYYCGDPILQHIFICRHILSLLDGSNTFGFKR